MQQELQDSRHRFHFERRAPEEIVFDFSVVRQFSLGQFSQKMPKNVVALVPVEDESEFLLRNFFPDASQKEPPSFLMSWMTVDDDAVHIKDHRALLAIL